MSPTPAAKPATPKAATFEYVTYIVASPDKLWTALTHSEYTRRYFFGRGIESDWKVGSTWTLRMDDGRVDSSGKVLTCEPPRKLSMTWHVEWLAEYRKLPAAIVTYQLDPLGGMMRLTMTEAHPKPIDEKYLEGGRRGWPVILSGLKTLLETGQPLPRFDPSA